MSQVEPSADMRQWAHIMREMYVALLAEGFSTEEAFGILGRVIASGMNGGGE